MSPLTAFKKFFVCLNLLESKSAPKHRGDTLDPTSKGRTDSSGGI